ncbi:MAG: hypothetical protein KDK70_38860 [Myxococcales bacterium]|nr:hypothetical protein [Myxococcales bacterium]
MLDRSDRQVPPATPAHPIRQPAPELSLPEPPVLESLPEPEPELPEPELVPSLVSPVLELEVVSAPLVPASSVVPSPPTVSAGAATTSAACSVAGPATSSFGSLVGRLNSELGATEVAAVLNAEGFVTGAGSWYAHSPFDIHTPRPRWLHRCWKLPSFAPGGEFNEAEVICPG